MSTSSLVLTASTVPFLLLALWHLTAHLVTTSVTLPSLRSTLTHARIVLLIAHPDDEAMFFAPTLLHLTRPELGNHVKILCLSSGDADGLGSVRKGEVKKSALRLGVKREEDVFVLEDGRFRDGMAERWDEGTVAGVLAEAFVQQQEDSQGVGGRGKEAALGIKQQKQQPQGNGKLTARGGAAVGGSPKSTTAVTASIDVLITFDRDGVSSHPNHKALYHGARAFLRDHLHIKSSAFSSSSSDSPSPSVQLYTLPTVNLVRKYISVWDAVLSLLLGVLDQLFNRQDYPSHHPNPPLAPTITASRNRGTGVAKVTIQRDGDDSSSSRRRNRQSLIGSGRRMLFVNGLGEYIRAAGAMVRAHESQMRWFRWGWVAVGRYMVVNELRREEV